METLIALLTALNTLSPLGLAALLAVIIFYQVRNAKKVSQVHVLVNSKMTEQLEKVARLEAELVILHAEILTLKK